MKKLLTLTATCAMLTAPATAVQKCVAIFPGEITNCTATNTYSKTGWEATCTFGTQTTITPEVKIIGQSACVGSAKSSYYTTSDDLHLTYDSGSVNNSRQCWCRMISPVMSKWVYIYQSNTGFDCSKDCSAMCTARLKDNASFQSAIFTNIVEAE